MDSVVSKIQETGQNTVKKADAVVARTLEAGETFLGELSGVRRDIGLFVRGEAKTWRRFFVQRATQLRTEAKTFLAAPAVERRVLAQVDGALRAIDGKVRARLTALEPRAKRAVRRATPRKPVRRVKAAMTAAGHAAAARH